MSLEQLEFLIQRLKERPYPPYPAYQDLRADMQRLAESFYISPDVQVAETRLAGRPALELLAPGAERGRALLYLHGGAYVAGSPRTHGELAARISRATGMRAVSLDYRLAPEHPFPAAIEDAVAACRALREQGTAPRRMVIAGDSAGGGLALATLLALRDAGDPLPAAAVLLSPWVDLEGTGESVRALAARDPIANVKLITLGRTLYLNGADPRHPLAAPLHADLAGLPPLLIQVGTREVLLDDSRRLATKARAAGCDVTLEEFPEMIHVWQIFAPILEEGQRAIEKIGEWVRGRMG
jgi:acetyl esterase/lipase